MVHIIIAHEEHCFTVGTLFMCSDYLISVTTLSDLITQLTFQWW